MPSGNVRGSALTPRYRYNIVAGRYIDNRGRYVSQAKVLNALERQSKVSERQILRLAERLSNGDIDLQTWRMGMVRELKSLHLINTAVARGGWARMTSADYGRVGGRLARQYEYLNRLASQIQYGTQQLNGQFIQRVKMYVGAARGTYQIERDEVVKELEFDQESNVLGNAEHCEECIRETARGWVPLGTLMPIGQRLCKTNCKCHKRYRNSKTGKIME